MSVEKVEIGLATLYLGDSAEVATLIKDKEIAHTITDPPYEEAAHSEQRRVYAAGGGLKSGHLRFAQMDADLRDTIAKQIIRVTREWAMLFCQLEGWHDWRDAMLKHGALGDHPMLWCKPDGKPRFDGTGPAPAYEVIELAYCGNGRRTWNGGGTRGFFIENWSETRDEGNTHQTVKPQSLMGKLVTLFTNKDDVIFDPFMGSGSTGVAAVGQGRKFIGVEREREYFDVCCARIEKTQTGIVHQPYIKTKARVTVPLFETAKKVSPIAAAKPRVVVANKPRFSMPTIVSTAPELRPVKAMRPLEDPFADQLKLLSENEPPAYDAAQWFSTKHGAVGMDVESFSNYFLLCFKDFLTGQRISFERGERADFDPKQVEEILKECIITFNGTTYDVPMVALALRGAGPEELKGASNRLVDGHIKPWELEKELRVSIPKINHVDLMEPNPSIRQGLKVLHGRLHGKIIMDMPFDHNSRLNRRQMNIATLYCMNDLDATHALFDALREPLRLRVALGKRYGLDLRSKSDAQVGEAVVLERVRRVTGKRIKKNYGDTSHPPFRYDVPPFVQFETAQLNAVLDKLRDEEFTVGGYGVEAPKWLKETTINIGSSTYQMGIGGLHSTEGTRAEYSDDEHVLIDVDVAGHYPATMIKLGMYPPTVGPAFQPEYKGIVVERLDAKKLSQKKDIEEAVRVAAKSDADGGKIAANGVFGKILSVNGVLSHPPFGIAITITGQLSVLMLIERAEARGIAAISGNTDGVLFKCPRRLEPDLMDMIKNWETETGFEVETTRYASIHNSSVNSYIAVKDDGKVKMKGPHADPWKENDLRTMMMKNPQMTVCTEAVLRFIKEGVPFEETIRAETDPRRFVTVINVKSGAVWRDKKIGKVVRYYWSTDSDSIRYSDGSRKVAKTDGARPMMVLPDTLPDDVDFDRYMSATEKLAADLGVIQEQGLLRRNA